MNKKHNAILWLLLFAVLLMIWVILQPLIIFLSTIIAFFGNGKLKQYGVNCWEGKDNLISAQTGGSPDESISSRLGKAREKNSKWAVIANKVDLVAKELFNDDDHCNKSIERDRGKKQVTNY